MALSHQHKVSPLRPIKPSLFSIKSDLLKDGGQLSVLVMFELYVGSCQGDDSGAYCQCDSGHHHTLTGPSLQRASTASQGLPLSLWRHNLIRQTNIRCQWHILFKRKVQQFFFVCIQLCLCIKCCNAAFKDFWRCVGNLDIYQSVRTSKSWACCFHSVCEAGRESDVNEHYYQNKDR